jgi:hypothetical protein
MLDLDDKVEYDALEVLLDLERQKIIRWKNRWILEDGMYANKHWVYQFQDFLTENEPFKINQNIWILISLVNKNSGDLINYSYDFEIMGLKKTPKGIWIKLKKLKESNDGR